MKKKKEKKNPVKYKKLKRNIRVEIKRINEY